MQRRDAHSTSRVLVAFAPEACCLNDCEPVHVTDTTTYLYEEATGNLLSVTNALGHQTTLGNYDAHGKPRQITDPNGLVTTLVWDERQRLTSRTVGQELTSYTYDGVGQLTRITLPDASFLDYFYDEAHRLTEVRDNLGNKVSYTLDAMGNRTLEETRDPGGVLKATRSREYSNLNRLIKNIGGTNPALQVTQYGYDNQGNLTSIDGPLTGTPNDLSVLTYDALNRLKDVTNPLSGLTRYGHDGLDQFTSVTDPRNNATGYTVSGLGDQTQEVSPDRGTTNRLFDAAGNLTSSTDGRPKTTTYTYDALNRLTQTTFQDATSISYAWDQGTAQKGRLTTIAFPGGNTTYTYDAHGRVTQKRDTHSTGRVFTVNYAWNATTGRLTSITYPKGKVLTFGYDAAGRVTSLTVGSSIIATNIAYFPFGAPSGWTWGNSLTVTRSFDLDGRLTSFPLSTTDSRNVTYDAASRITEVKHPTNPSLAQTMGYDLLDRLTSWVDASSTRGYGYDANGNRTSLTIGGNSYTYTTPPTTNRLASTSGPAPARTFSYNGAGDTTGDGQFALTYNDRGRLVQAVKGSTTATYTLDGVGQRVKKTGPTSIVPSGTNYFVYDEDGKLLGEYNSSGALIQEYVWLGSMPIAVLRGSTGTPTIFYVYADQVDRPWVITNAANQLRWRWDTSPFGELVANQNPGGLGNFAFNLRFPGQYRDAETALHYNYFRDYDPQTGRYVQSDPIGLAGGINPYLYVRGNPLSYVDPDGQQVLPPGLDPFAPGFNPPQSPLELGNAPPPQVGQFSEALMYWGVGGGVGALVLTGGVGLASLTPQQLAAMCFAALSGLGQLNKYAGISKTPLTPPPMSTSGAAKVLQEIQKASQAAGKATSGFSRPLTGAAMGAPAACASQCDSR
jgi:RHS repeat-associated protein